MGTSPHNHHHLAAHHRDARAPPEAGRRCKPLLLVSRCMRGGVRLDRAPTHLMGGWAFGCALCLMAAQHAHPSFWTGLMHSGPRVEPPVHCGVLFFVTRGWVRVRWASRCAARDRVRPVSRRAVLHVSGLVAPTPHPHPHPRRCSDAGQPARVAFASPGRPVPRGWPLPDRVQCPRER